MKSSTQLYHCSATARFETGLNANDIIFQNILHALDVDLALGLWAEDLVQVHDVKRPCLHLHTPAHVYKLV